MRIAALEPSGHLYGSEYCLLDIVDGLPRSDYEWTVYLPRGNGFDELLLARDLACEFLLPQGLVDLSKLRKAVVYARLYNRLRQQRPNVVYVNQAGMLRVASACARGLRLPIVCQVQTLEDARWLSAQIDLHGVVMSFICNSRFIASETACDESKKCVLYQGMRPERVRFAEQNFELRRRALASGRPGSDISVGILGRIAVSKGHYLLIEAAKLLYSAAPSVRFIVIGDSLTPADTRKFHEAVVEAGLAQKFEFRGYRSDLVSECARLDLLVIPSLAEPLGRVLFDAAENAVPVVLSDAGGLGEISKKFNVGVRFRSGDATSLADALLYALDNAPMVQSQFRAAAMGMLGRLSMNSYLARVEKILQSAAQGLPAATLWLGDGIPG